MRNIIKKIFEIKECEVNSLEKGLLIKNKNKTSFYVVDFFKEDNREHLWKKIEETQEKFYEFFSNQKDSKGIIKNTNFLIIIEGDLYSKEVEKIIFDLEEDEYFFRKYVLVYSKKEYDSFIKELETKNINSLLKEALTNKRKFQKFKLNKTYDWLSLILKMYIKIPELNYFDKGKRDLELPDLAEEIKKELEHLELVKIKEFCLEIAENIGDIELEKLILDYGVEHAEN